MFLSDRDLRWARQCGRLLVEPPPTTIDPTSLDLHLDHVREAKVWDTARYLQEHPTSSGAPELVLGSFVWAEFSERYLMDPPTDSSAPVYRRDDKVVVKPGGFLLWQTKERVGTPAEGADLICFVEGKSTRARTGLQIHLAAPTIHASWSGMITLEIANLGPFHFVLGENDVIAQLTVATISSPPEKNMRGAGSVTVGQGHVSGAPTAPAPSPGRRKPRRRKG
jgi:dCTP deaminase